MRTKALTRAGYFVLFFASAGFSEADIPVGYVWSQNLVDIYGDVPPALIFIQDKNGSRTGGNPDLPVDAYGRQGGTLDGLDEIPLSSVEQVNIGSDDPADQGQPQPTTGWTIHLLDGGSQTYRVNLVGLKTGMSEITVTQYIAPPAAHRKFQSMIDALVSQGVTTQLDLTIDAQTGSISSTRVASSKTLFQDVQTACQMGLITSNRACDFLTRQARLIDQALDKDRDEEARAQIRVFLHALGYSRPFGCRDEDHHGEVKQPALGILQEDAKALLDQVGKPDRHFGEKRR
ncbi:MAG TPA: hypothetical protein VFR02_05845 [bacterium]|nr:hypothetical protein [bacterium]